MEGWGTTRSLLVKISCLCGNLVDSAERMQGVAKKRMNCKIGASQLSTLVRVSTCLEELYKNGSTNVVKFTSLNLDRGNIVVFRFE
jgi:hypothetical protein